MKIGEFFKLTKEKVLLDLTLSFVLVIFLFFNVPLLKAIFFSRTILIQIFDILLNTIIFGIVLYPLSCLFIFLVREIFKKEIKINRMKRKKRKRRKK